MECSKIWLAKCFPHSWTFFDISPLPYELRECSSNFAHPELLMTQSRVSNNVVKERRQKETWLSFALLILFFTSTTHWKLWRGHVFSCLIEISVLFEVLLSHIFTSRVSWRRFPIRDWETQEQALLFSFRFTPCLEFFGWFFLLLAVLLLGQQAVTCYAIHRLFWWLLLSRISRVKFNRWRRLWDSEMEGLMNGKLKAFEKWNSELLLYRQEDGLKRTQMWGVMYCRWPI